MESEDRCALTFLPAIPLPVSLTVSWRDGGGRLQFLL